MIERSVKAGIHGRYLTIAPAERGPAPILMGFHGYGENAEIQLERLRAIPGSGRWLIVSVQGLHRFYRRSSNEVVASWMTRQNREEAIGDNLTYVANCLDAVEAEWQTRPVVVFAGFSQGVAMAFRAGVDTARRVGGVIAVGGDIPPEIAPVALRRVGAALIARGTSDVLYREETFAQDERRLRESSVSVRAVLLNAGHEWTEEFRDAASVFLTERVL